jgi:glutathione S-transferase
MILFDSAVSGNCYKVRLLLAHRGLTAERRALDVIDRTNRPEVLGGLNPALRVPTLVLDDGRPLAESNAIIWYLAEGTDWIPGDPYERAQMLQWLFFEQYSHEPYIAVARLWTSVHPDGAPSEAALQERRRGGEGALDAMESHLTGRTFLVGDHISLADVALYAYTHVAGEGGFDLSGRPAITAWLARVAATPGHIPIDA